MTFAFGIALSTSALVPEKELRRSTDQARSIVEIRRFVGGNIARSWSDSHRRRRRQGASAWRAALGLGVELRLASTAVSAAALSSMIVVAIETRSERVP